MRKKNWAMAAALTTAAASLVLVGACSVEVKKEAAGTTTPPAPGGTGAFGIVTVGGKQKLYLPQKQTNDAGNAVVSVVDVGLRGNGVAGAKALIKDIDLGDADFATASGGDSTVVIAVSTENPKIRFIDPKTDTLLKTVSLPSTFGQSSFSGGGGYVTGVAVDSAHRRAILSVYDGFQLVDLDTMELTTHIDAAPAENFGFDSVRGWILAPFYDCSDSSGPNGAPKTCADYKTPGGQVITQGLNVIDLADGTVYTYQNAAAEDPTQPMGDEPDSASIDPATGIAVVPSEGGDFQNVIDLSQAQFDKGTKSVTAPSKKFGTFGYEGVSIETSSHLGFWENENSSRIAAADLKVAPDGGPGSYVLADMPDLPNANGFTTLGDPHGIAVTSGITNGKPVGVLVSSDRTWVARVDLGTLLAPAKDPGTTTGNVPSTQVESAVTYLDARNSPTASSPVGDGGS